MLPPTRGSEASRVDPETTNISVVLETLALFFVVVFFVAMILALITVFQ